MKETNTNKINVAISHFVYKLFSDLDLSFLNIKEREILTKYFVESKDFESISNDVILTRDRVKQLFHKALIKTVKYFSCMEQYRKENERLSKELSDLKFKLGEAIKELADYKRAEESFVKINIEQKFKFSKISIDKLNLSKRLYNCLEACGISNLFQIVQYDADDVMKFRNFGKGCLLELENILAERGLRLGMFE